MEAFATKTASLFSEFKVNFYSSVIRKMVTLIQEKKETKPVILKLNIDNNLYVVPQGLYIITQVIKFLWPMVLISNKKLIEHLREYSYKSWKIPKDISRIL